MSREVIPDAPGKCAIEKLVESANMLKCQQTIEEGEEGHEDGGGGMGKGT